MALMKLIANRSVSASLLLFVIKAYQVLISSWRPPSCRFLPSCSEYAAQAVNEHGMARGVLLALKRLARCHPFGGSGIDEVPLACPASGDCHQNKSLAIGSVHTDDCRSTILTHNRTD